MIGLRMPLWGLAILPRLQFALHSRCSAARGLCPAKRGTEQLSGDGSWISLTFPLVVMRPILFPVAVKDVNSMLLCGPRTTCGVTCLATSDGHCSLARRVYFATSRQIASRVR